MLEWNKKCVKVMIFFKNLRFLESIQGFFPTLFIIMTFHASPLLTFDYIFLIPLFASIILSHQFVYIINDFYDYPTDSNNPRKKYTRTLSQEKRFFFILLIIFINILTFNYYSDHFLIFILNGFFFFLGLLYSHPTTHFKSNQYLSFVIHFLYGFLSSSIGYFILKDFHFINKIDFLLFFLSGTIFGFIFLAGNIMSAMLDQKIEPKSWIKESCSAQIKYYKNILWTIIFLLFSFYLIKLKEYVIFLTPAFFILTYGLYKTFKRISLCKRSQKASIIIRDSVRFYFFLFFLFQFFYKLSFFEE